MKNCSYCGRDNADEVLNCRECGTEFELPSAPEEPKLVVPSRSGQKSEVRSSEVKPALKYDSILVSSRGIAETHARKVVIFVPAIEVDRIILKFGHSDHHPVLTISIGTVLALAGVFGLAELILAPQGFRYELGLVAFGFVGGSMIFDTLKKRYFLEVHKKQGICRLVLSKSAQEKDIQEFCDKIRSIYNYKITDSAK